MPRLQRQRCNREIPRRRFFSLLQEKRREMPQNKHQKGQSFYQNDCPCLKTAMEEILFYSWIRH